MSSMHVPLKFLPPQVEDFNENLEDFQLGIVGAINDQYQVTSENVFIVAPSPRIVGSRYTYLQVVFFVQLGNGAVVSAYLLAAAVNENRMTLAEQVLIINCSLSLNYSMLYNWMAGHLQIGGGLSLYSLIIAPDSTTNIYCNINDTPKHVRFWFIKLN